MEEKVKLMVYYRVGNSHPYDYRALTYDDVFKILTTEEDIVQIYLAQAERETGILGQFPTFLDYVDDFNSQDMDNGADMWLAFLKVSRELVENYLKK